MKFVVVRNVQHVNVVIVYVKPVGVVNVVIVQHHKRYALHQMIHAYVLPMANVNVENVNVKIIFMVHIVNQIQHQVVVHYVHIMNHVLNVLFNVKIMLNVMIL